MSYRESLCASPIVKVVTVEWSVGMDRLSLAEKMQNVINNFDKAGLGCVGVERVTEFLWLMLFAARVGANDA